MPRRLSKILFYLLLSGCAHPPPEPPTDTTQGIPAVEYAVISYGNEVERDAQLFLLDSRACFTKDGIVKLVMHFRTQRLVDLCEGRDLIVEFVEGFLRRINSDPTIVSYLNPFPLTADRLKINIEFESFFGRYIDPLYMGRIALEKGIVFYYTHDSLDPDTTKWKQRVEPYEKAFRFSHFRNEDRMQYPESPNTCLGGKYRIHDRSKEPYDHVTSRCCSASKEIPDTLIMTENKSYPCDNTNCGGSVDCDEKMECGLPHESDKAQPSPSMQHQKTLQPLLSPATSQYAEPAQFQEAPQIPQLIQPIPSLQTGRPHLHAESLRYPKSTQPKNALLQSSGQTNPPETPAALQPTQSLQPSRVHPLQSLDSLRYPETTPPPLISQPRQFPVQHSEPPQTPKTSPSLEYPQAPQSLQLSGSPRSPIQSSG